MVQHGQLQWGIENKLWYDAANTWTAVHVSLAASTALCKCLLDQRLKLLPQNIHETPLCVTRLHNSQL